MKKVYPVSIVVFVGMVVAGIVLAGSSLGVFISLGSFIIVVGLPAAVIFATHSPGEVGRAFAAPSRSDSPAELKASAVFFSAMQRYLLWSGFLATMIGVITLLAYLGETASVGRGAALALLTVFYSVVLNLVVALPFRHAAEKRLAELG
jgi:flagellar motor component MotA